MIERAVHPQTTCASQVKMMHLSLIGAQESKQPFHLRGSAALQFVQNNLNQTLMNITISAPYALCKTFFTEDDSTKWMRKLFQSTRK